ncbi:homoserine O-acetyltransferase [Pseudoflavitalea sp. G-6-1-2]|uniref:homoserine O-acetyltransferase family protein n=1 Tax=Pseudoflavitalea sp. G-6-1-2 TaxID=2728841 RepID=UPI00146CBE5D|nr:homoserine O-acetyltransferase [Pseudoflavitalea sp. G-6-1-2]NML19395.1 homoserine O-acetyltransferase [Pseudoflavitalea sp. G-6-1-2]
MQTFHIKQPFQLESGEILPEITIAYHTYGTLKPNSKVVWVCHALTANSDAADWWKGVIGEGDVINPQEYFIICANILGSCYGSTGPLSTDPHTGQPYYHNFPLITIRDMVQAHILLRKHLGIDQIWLLMGGSMGGYQCLEWSVMEPSVIHQLFLLATSPTESAWGIAVHTTQRLAIETDATWKEQRPDAGAAGLKAARAVGMLTYRNYGIMVKHQTDPDHSKLDNYRASSYIHYQGEKLVKRFNAFTYWTLTKSMDSHHLGRGRNGDVEAVLQNIQQRTLIVGISSDILCPVEEQRFIQRQLPNASLIEIDSAYGHDGFMVEGKMISEELGRWLKK